MREESGDIWTYPADAICIPVNWTTRRNGDAVMGAGVAKQAAELWPWLAASLGNTIKHSAPAVTCFSTPGPWLLLVPTKHDWRKPSTPELVKLGAERMVDVVDRHGWQAVALPRLGCGPKTGRLDWETQVRPLLSAILDDRFIVLTPEAW